MRFDCEHYVVFGEGTAATLAELPRVFGTRHWW
jgi:hypothetical protein